MTNTYKPEPEKISVSGSKMWEDDDDAAGKRPESITINLLADGEKIDSVIVTADDNWSWSFTDLPKHENGTEIVYTIDEEAVEGYAKVINGYNVTNTYVPVNPVPTPSETPDSTPIATPVPAPEQTSRPIPVPTPARAQSTPAPTATPKPTMVEPNWGSGSVELVEIPDEDVPLAAAPITGDTTVLVLMLSILSFTGLSILLIMGRKKREDKE